MTRQNDTRIRVSPGAVLKGGRGGNPPGAEDAGPCFRPRGRCVAAAPRRVVFDGCVVAARTASGNKNRAAKPFVPFQNVYLGLQMVQSPRKNSARLSAGPCRMRLRALPIAPLPSVVPSLRDPFPPRPLPSATPPLRDPFPPRPLPSATPSLCDPSPPRPLPTAGPSGCPSIPFGCGGGRQGRERGTTVCFTRDRLRRAAAVGSVWRKGGMTGGRRLPGLQGGLVRMAGGDCRGCKVRLVAWRAAVAGAAR